MAVEIEHEVRTLVGQRVFAIALGYEDLNDHDELRHDPVLAVLAGKLAAKRQDCAPLAGKSTLNRLELGRGDTRSLQRRTSPSYSRRRSKTAESREFSRRSWLESRGTFCHGQAQRPPAFVGFRTTTPCLVNKTG